MESAETLKVTEKRSSESVEWRLSNSNGSFSQWAGCGPVPSAEGGTHECSVSVAAATALIDLMEASPSLPSVPARAPLLLAFVHGNNGDPDDWTPLIATVRANPVFAEAHFVRFSSHAGKRTLVGVQLLATAFVKEVVARTHEPDLAASTHIRLYVFGHSLGGLVMRCALPELFAQ